MKGLLIIATVFSVFVFIPISSSAQKIFSCNHSYEADIKVYVAKHTYEADLLVYKVDQSYQAGDNNGNWYFVKYKYEADKVIYFCNHNYEADLVICFVDNSYEAKWRENEKKYLLY